MLLYKAYGYAPMIFYIYSITYLEDGLETKREDGIMTASSYADAMAEIDEWDLSVEEVRLREICGEYQGPDCERPWISIESLKDALEGAGFQLSAEPVRECSCGEKDNRPVVPDYVGDCVNDK